MLCYLLLISIVLSTYAFLTCVHSMFHLVIQVCLSYIHIIYDFHGYILYHLLCSISMYCYHVPLSYTVIMYCFHILLSCTAIYCIHVLFHVLFSYTVFLLYFSYYFLFHVLYLFIYFSNHFTFLYIFIYHVGLYNLMVQNLSSHSSAMLLISYHIFSHVIFKSFILCFMHVNTKEVDT